MIKKFSIIDALIKVCGLIVVHIQHSVFYALPTLLLLAGVLYLLQQEYEWYYVYGCVMLFFLSNVLFVYATTEQMLRAKPGGVDIAGVFIWRRHHSTFFIFVSLGIILLCVLSVYFLDVADYLRQMAEKIGIERDNQPPGYSIIRGSYNVLIFGSNAAAVVLLLLVLWMWNYICRTGVRMPAYVEGYDLRVEEALGLTREHAIGIMAVSLMFLLAVSTFSDAAIEKWGIGAKRAITVIMTWTIAYFFIVISHIAIWVYSYKVMVKSVGYHLSPFSH